MQIFLPIADISVNLIWLLGLGAAVGFLSGMFGVGGGFLMTPMLIFTGIPPAVAVSTEANQITASSTSGAIAHWRRQGVDLRMGLLLVAGGAVGSVLGVAIFSALRESGQIDVFIALAYVSFLSIIGGLMLAESVRALRRDPDAPASTRPRGQRFAFLRALPWQMHFPTSGLQISIIPPIALGVLVGMLAALMGVGGGFIMVPAMIYLLRMPTNVVVGTSLFQIVFVTAITTFLQAVENQTVDVVLAACLIVGGVIGAQVGARVGARFRAEQLRAGLALMVLVVGLKLAYDLIVTPGEMFALMPAL
ncbi:MAG: sulfite exporter TauE/SafE family protein [Maricaulaceae bacterium]|jgi:hypothetical protein